LKEIPMSIAPITPGDVAAGAAGAVPDFVLQAFNELLAQKARNGSARITQNEVIERIISLSPTPLPRQQIFDKNWLDVESIYRAAGWKVRYDKPGYCENYDAYFEFKKA
jgi:hypothetical protein